MKELAYTYDVIFSALIIYTQSILGSAIVIEKTGYTWGKVLCVATHMCNQCA